MIRRQTIVLSLSLTLLLAAACASTPSDPGVVITENGAVRGGVAGTIIAFKGIPFAQAPVGDLRWRAPQPASDWRGVRDGSAYGPDCQQEPFPGDAAPLGVEPSEDCLYLNVWAPADRGEEPLPVMFWIYGGGFVNGGASPAVYDGSEFARNGVILVSANYRVGRFGFFAHPALTAENADGGRLGNYAVMDQIAALEWVQRNIAAFGGDPDKVTIFGESAGGMSIHYLMTSDLADGLFAQAISESGLGRSGPLGAIPFSAPAGQRSGESVGLDFARQNGIEGTGSGALAALRALPAEAVENGLNMMTSGGQPYSGPIKDGVVIAEEPDTVYAAGREAPAPLIVGANDGDGFFFGPPDLDQIYAAFGDRAADARRVYGASAGEDARRVGTYVSADQLFLEPARYLARLHEANGHPTWVYRFSYVAESLRDEWVGAQHATEIPFVFDTVAARYGAELTAADSRAADLTHAYWVAFAKTGVPAPTGLQAWPQYDPAQDVIIDFRAEGPVVGPDPARDRLDLVEEIVEARAPR
jgi:para-nitrobenzyl esterase